MNDKELLEKAKEMYPPGTVYYVAHMPNSKIECTIGEDPLYWYHGYIMQSMGNSSKNGHGITEIVYDLSCRKWAEIISPKVVQFKFDL